jgi:threonine dehydratase
MSHLSQALRRAARLATFAAALKERARLQGKRVAVVQSGGNADHALFAQVLAEPDPE